MPRLPRESGKEIYAFVSSYELPLVTSYLAVRLEGCIQRALDQENDEARGRPIVYPCHGHARERTQELLSMIRIIRLGL